MSKIICDICGTSYSETAKQCPICGCVRPGDVQRVTNEINSDGNGATGYTYVKGGRFSKSNVKKRAKANGTKVNKKPAAVGGNKEKEPGNKRGLVIVAIVLLLAIIGVVIYISIGFFGGTGNDSGNSKPSENGQLDLSCRGIKLDTGMVILSKPGNAQLLSYKLQPENTTDKITFTSENPEIATVDEKGNIAAVAEGETKVVVKCGDAEAVCIVYCQFEKEPTIATLPTTGATDSTGSTDSTEPTDSTDPTGTTTPTGNPTGTIRLNRTDVTFTYKGESWMLYSGELDKNLITFTSDDEKVVTFVDGRAVAVGGGAANVYASYGDQKVSCLIRCNFKESTGVEGNGGVSEDGGGSANIGTPVNLSGKIINVQEFVNVRSDAGTEYAQVGKLTLGEQITITEMKNDSTGMKWYKTSVGWVREDFVLLDSN